VHLKKKDKMNYMGNNSTLKNSVYRNKCYMMTANSSESFNPKARKITTL